MFNAVKLTGLDLGGGAVFVDPGELRGHRIGTYLMDYVVHWARQWPDAIVESIKLQADQGKGEAGLRRNRFYEQFGLRFDYTTEERLAGMSIPMPAGELVECRAWEQNITVHELPTVLARQFSTARETEDELSYLNKTVQDQARELQIAQLKPFRWALRQGWQSLVIPGVITLMAAIAYWQLTN
ncbi:MULTISPECIES: GNAT family N-acetyltransferase [Achromobacter]|nr:GNAT family N-acetyltransferase [Achromobacter xylosoxidans]